MLPYPCNETLVTTIPIKSPRGLEIWDATENNYMKITGRTLSLATSNRK